MGCLLLSVSKKSVTFLHAEKCHIFCEACASRKISLRSSKSLIAQAFLMAIIQFEEGLFSLRLGHGAALTCPRHVIHSRAAASLPLKLPRCAVIFPQQHGFFDSLSNKHPTRGACCYLKRYSLASTAGRSAEVSTSSEMLCAETVSQSASGFTPRLNAPLMTLGLSTGSILRPFSHMK